MKTFRQEILIFFMITCMAGAAFSQAKKPTLMVVPDDVWCTANGYMVEYDNQGSVMRVPDYQRAVQENADLLLVVSKINELMADRGFPLKNLASVLKSLQSQAAEDAMMTSKKGSQVSESPIDKLRKTAKADIWIQMNWTVTTTGPKKVITFNLNGIDAYTDKAIAGSNGEGLPSTTASLATLLQEAVLAHLDNFNTQLQSHFDDLFENGREVVLRIRKFDGFDGDLESEYGGEELGTLIENWVNDNTVNNRFSTADATENQMFFEQVRIPLYDENNRPVDTRNWARGIQKMLKSDYQIDSKLLTKGLGEAIIYVGEK